MLRNLICMALAASMAASVGFAADQTTTRTVLPVNRTPANDGKQMYSNYCAPCHGVNGRGNGPIASALKKQPADLTALQHNNGGKYPATHVSAILQFGIENPAHGTAQMPVWGPLFGKMDQAASTVSESDSRALRISNINRYIESMQLR